MTIVECAARGAVLLDERRPGWASLIDVDELDISSPVVCALGQIYANEAISLHYSTRFPFEIGRTRLGLTHCDTVMHGFALGFCWDYSRGEEFDSDEEGFAMLNDAWLVEIAMRTSLVPAAVSFGPEAAFEEAELQLA